MKDNINEYHFLSGGGEMGKLIRAKDWSKTPLGDPKDWPSSLRTMVSVMLNNPFGMYIAWGKEYTQLYNDGYRPILGSTKHPQALGIGTRETFSEIWHIIGSMFKGVMEGQPVGFPDFMLPLNRNGYIENCYFDFSYSPIRRENGEVGGVLVTVIETTLKKKAEVELIESEQRLQFAIEAAEMGTFDYNPLSKKYTVNHRIIDWFGLNPNKPSDLKEVIYMVAEKDREKVIKAYKEALNYELGGMYDIVCTLIHPISKIERIIRAKGKASFNDEKIAYRFNGTIQEITEQYKVEKEKEKLIAIIESSEEFICLARMDFSTQYINPAALEMLGWDNYEGRFLIDCVYPDDRAFATAVLSEFVEKGSFQHEIRFWNERTGVPFWLQWNGFALKELPSDKVIGLASVSPNITERKKTEEQRQISETNLRLIIHQAPVAIAILRSPDYIVEIANSKTLELWGRTEEEVMNKPILEAMFELQSQGIKALLDDVYTTGNRFSSTELPVQIFRNGKLDLRYINFSYEPFYDADGKIDGIMPVGFDVTEHVLSRQKIEANEEKLNIVINASELGIWEYNIKTTDVIYSAHCSKILGFEGKTDLNHLTLISHFHPDDLTVRRDAFLKSFETGYINYEARVIWEDKSIHWIESKGKVFYNSNHEPERLLGTLRDITDEKKIQQQLQEREQKFRLLADSMPQHVWTSDTEGVLDYFNQSVLNYSGLTLEKILKDGWLQIVHPDDREENIRLWIDAITTGKDFLFEHRFRRYDGVYRWQLSRAIPQKDENGKIQRWVGTSTDIQEQKIFATELEKKVSERTRELEQKNIDLDKMNKELQAFAYISSHDLQEPLRKIQTFASRIVEKEEHNLSDIGKDYFKRMKSAADRMQTLIQDLLVYSRTNTSERKFELIELKDLMEEIKRDIKEEIEQKQGVIEILETCPVKMINFQLKQLLLNLISNSLKFSNPLNPPHITISCETHLGKKFQNVKLIPDKEYCHIRISDNGIGFEQKYSEKIFELFQRLNAKDKYIGTGIGLAIVKRIVENHGGTITAKGEINKGATFDIYIPTI